MARDKITLLLVDDHPLLLAGLKAHFAPIEHIEVVGEAVEGRQAMQLVQELQPDIVLMDINLPDISGLEATRQLHQALPEVQIIILSVHDDEEYIMEAVQVGARGYLLKDTMPDKLDQAVESVYRGEVYFDVNILQIMASGYARQATVEKKAALTPRECQVLKQIALGKTNKETAKLLSLGVRTVETYRERIMGKLDIHTVAGLTRYAINEGLIPLD
jgi:two-component system nitrate/nitrite response regulator NarL